MSADVVMTKLWIVLMGAPGCGKGTLVENLIASNDYKIISVGDILRCAKDTKLPGEDKTIGEMIGAGFLLSDEIIIKLVREELKKIEDPAHSNVLFDGFPRTEGQAAALDVLSKEFHKKIDKVLIFKVKDAIITKRILGRYTCKNCKKIYNSYFFNPSKAGFCDVCGCTEFDKRGDDNEESLIKRLAEYHLKTAPLIDFYFNRIGVFCEINAEQDSKDVFEEVKGVLSNKKLTLCGKIKKFFLKSC